MNVPTAVGHATSDFLKMRKRLSSDKRRRANLLRKDPHCYWCGILVVYFNTNGGPVPDNFATIDHIQTRNTDYRKLSAILNGRQFTKDKTNTVLACARCNAKRNNEEQRALYKEGGETILRLSGQVF